MGDVALLAQHAVFMPLVPGDVVQLDGFKVIGVESLLSTYTWEVELALPAGMQWGQTPTGDHPAMQQVDILERTWAQHATVTRPTNFTLLVSTPDLGWLKQNVANNALVDFFEEIRTPAMTLDFEHARQNPSV